MRVGTSARIPSQAEGEPRPGVFAAERLAVRAVSKSWDRGRQRVLDAVDLVLEPGMLTSLVGSNGAGKTTFLRIVAGLIAPDSGTVTVDGLQPERDRREYQRRIGFLSAGQTGLYARFTVIQHLRYWARIAFVDRGRRAAAVERSLDEPRASLDDDGRGALVATLDAFVGDGGAAIWCAPAADEIELPVAHALTLANGRLTGS